MASARHSQTDALARQVDSQLSFWLMQRRAVEAGDDTADFIVRLLERVPGLEKTRIHLMGHSFGPLVVTNALRRLVLDDEVQARLDRCFRGVIQSVSLFGAALATDWFRGETRVRNSVRTVLCPYSLYDTASGFYYPATNHGRVAAGFVGLSGDFKTEEYGGSGALVDPPDLGARDDSPMGRMVNYDASRLLYEGPPAQGGGHDDIFKDDAIYLFWAATGLQEPPSP